MAQEQEQQKQNREQNQEKVENRFEKEVLQSEIDDIKRRKFLDKDGNVKDRSESAVVDLDGLIEDEEYRSSALNNVIDELYDEQNNRAWDEWLDTVDGDKESNDPTRKGLVGLAFSGGGIRSATFNLGILQALHSLGIFKCVDYLSTVSGGGYIGSCVSSLYASLQDNQLENESKDPSDKKTIFPFKHEQGKRESSVFRYLRNHANYLAPDGFLDKLRIPAVLLRGIVVNFLVLMPYLLLAAIFTVWMMPNENHVNAREMVEVFGMMEMDSRFLYTKYMIGIFLFVLALFPLIFMFFRSDRRDRLATSWKLRQNTGHILGGYIALTGIVAFVELQPIAINAFHEFKMGSFDRFEISIFTGTLGTVLAMFANHLLPKISKLSGAIAVYLIGFIGFATFWMIYLALCDMAIDWDMLHEMVEVDNHQFVINDTDRLQLILLIAAAVGLGIHWLRSKVAFINARLSIIGIWTLIVAISGAFIYHYMVEPIPIAELSTVDMDQEEATMLGHYAIVAFGLWLYTIFCVDVNFTSIHRFYRDRLSKAYIVGYHAEGEDHPVKGDESDGKDKSDIQAQRVSSRSDHLHHKDTVKLSELNSNRAPYHLINTLLNLEKAKESHKNGRHGDFFIFSKNYIGGEITGYCKTEDMEASSRHVNLATAMAISGAAAAPNAGKVTVKPLIFIMAMLNIRLNYWLLNPAKVNGDDRKLHNSWFGRVGPAYLFRELLGKPDAKHNFVNLSDGGHIENLGVYELLRRQCRLIICGDGEADKGLAFQGLAELCRMAQIDLGIKIEVDGLDELRRGEQHHAIGTIYYSDGRIGKLIYLKSSMLGDNNLKATLGEEQYTTSPYRDDNLMFDENAYIAYYKNKNPDFPHQTTADQFFDEAQFECYRALGYQVAMNTLSTW